jgi:hypothetical protein
MTEAAFDQSWTGTGVACRYPMVTLPMREPEFLERTVGCRRDLLRSVIVKGKGITNDVT